MATIKSFSDLSQSKKLAEILPIESADMVYVHTTDLEGDEYYDNPVDACCEMILKLHELKML